MKKEINRELSEACERRAATIEELRGRLELAEQRLDQVELDRCNNRPTSVCLCAHTRDCAYAYYATPTLTCMVSHTQAEDGKKRSLEMIQALEAACTEVRAQLDVEKSTKSDREMDLQKEMAQVHTRLFRLFNLLNSVVSVLFLPVFAFTGYLSQSLSMDSTNTGHNFQTSLALTHSS